MLKDYADSIVALDYEDVPKDVIKKAKLCVADTIGVIVRGSLEPIFRSVSGTVAAMFSTKETSTLFSNGKKSGLLSAAYINSLAAHVLLFDDEHNQSILHPGSSIIPSIIATAEYKGSTGMEFLLSVIIAYETSLRFAKGLAPYHYELGFTPTGTVNSIGVAAGVSRILGLSAERTGVAMSISAQQMGGTRGYQTGGHMHYSMILSAAASANGIISSHMGSSDLEPHPDFTEKDSVFNRAFSMSKANGYLRVIGDGWDIREVEFKMFPSSRFCHGPVAWILDLMRSENLSAGDVKSIDIGIDAERLKISDIPTVETKGQAIFSLQYNVSAAIVNMGLKIDDFEDSAIADAEIQAMMKKVKIRHSVDCDRQYPKTWLTHINVETQDGRQFNESFDSLKMMSPSEEQTKGKFFGNMRSRLDESAIVEIWDTIMDLENVQSVSRLTDLISKNLKN